VPGAEEVIRRRDDLERALDRLYTADMNEPAAKAAGLLPEPATSSTLPVYISTAWMARAGDGNGSTCHAPLVHAAPALHAAGLAFTVESTIE
jgi:hypothetical protein